MIKKSPSRNQRSNRIKIKYVLQIGLLLGICLWLIFQVKHSHDSKKEFEEKDAKVLTKSSLNNNEILKLGRKDLPRPQDVLKIQNHKAEAEEEVVIEEENKHEEEVQEDEEEEEKNKHLEDGEEDEKQENKHDDGEKEEEDKHEEEEQDDEEEEKNKHAEDEDEDEKEENKLEEDAEDENNTVKGTDYEEHDIFKEEDENENKKGSNNHDADADTETNTHEAREEHYKGDDASSAVSQDARVPLTETQKTSFDNFNESLEVQGVGKPNNTQEIIHETRDDFSTRTEQTNVTSNSTATETFKSIQNGTAGAPSVQELDFQTMIHKEAIVTKDIQSDFNATVFRKPQNIKNISNTSTDSGLALPENIMTSNATSNEDKYSKETKDSIQLNNSEHALLEKLMKSNSTERKDLYKTDSIDSSAEKDTPANLDTLLDHHQDAAAV